MLNLFHILKIVVKCIIAKIRKTYYYKRKNRLPKIDSLSIRNTTSRNGGHCIL